MRRLRRWQPARRALFSFDLNPCGDIEMLTIETARIFEPLLKPSRYKGAWGGRGSGKSHYMEGAVVEYCLLNPGARIVCIREVQKTLAQSAKLLIENKIQSQGLRWIT
jgi:phage terminase large subunit